MRRLWATEPNFWFGVSTWEQPAFQLECLAVCASGSGHGTREYGRANRQRSKVPLYSARYSLASFPAKCFHIYVDIARRRRTVVM